MSVPAPLASLSLPLFGAPLFLVSEPGLVIAQCRAGIVGCFPALNARPPSQFASWLYSITSELGEARVRGERVAPYAVNQIVHASNIRLGHDMETCARFKVPIVITSLGAPATIVPAVHDWGGLVFHDVTSVRHAQKAIEAGVDGLILVAAGAGGHTGALSPFALVEEVRRIWHGPIVLAGSIATGRGILAAEIMGADFASMGTRFIATVEAQAAEGYKAMLVGGSAADIVTTAAVSGTPANFLRESLAQAGVDAGAAGGSLGMDEAKAWRDIWSAGQGLGSIDEVLPVAVLVAGLRAEYRAARSALFRGGVKVAPAGAPI